MQELEDVKADLSDVKGLWEAARHARHVMSCCVCRWRWWRGMDGGAWVYRCRASKLEAISAVSQKLVADNQVSVCRGCLAVHCRRLRCE